MRQGPSLFARYYLATQEPQVIGTLLIAWLLLSAAFGPAVGQAPNPGDYSAAEYELQELRGVMVRKRDSVQLSADVYAPMTSENLPAILWTVTHRRWTAVRRVVDPEI